MRRFRGLAAPVTLTFSERYNVVVGDTGAGKSNLLSLLAMTTRMDFEPLANESFDLAWEAVNDAGDQLVGCVTREVPPCTRVFYRAASRPTSWRWSIRVAPLGRPAFVLEDEGDGRVPDPSAAAGSLSHRLFLECARYAGSLADDGTTRADEGLGCLRGLTARRRTEDRSFPRFEPSVFVEAERPPTAVGLGGVAELRGAWPCAAANGRHISLGGEDLPWLERVRQDLGAATVRLLPHRVDEHASFQEGEWWIRYRGSDLAITFRPGLSVRHDALAYEQKRLLGLRWYLSTAPAAPAILDELSLGLPPAKVLALLAELADRQSFLATRDPRLVDAVAWRSPEEVGLGVVACTRDAEHRWTWRQLDTTEAARFYAASRAGDRPHRALRTEAWWGGAT